MSTQGTATIDFGAAPVDGASFVINDATLSGLTYAEAFFMASDSTADNTASDHAAAGALTRVTCSAPSGSSMTVEVHCMGGLVAGTFLLRYVAN